MKTSLLTSLVLLLALPVTAQETKDTEKRIAELEKKIEKLSIKKEETKDSGVSVKFGGRFHLDSVFYAKNNNTLPNGTQLRRGRISFKATFGKDWIAEGDYDFAEGGSSIKDMYLGYQGIKNTLIQVGQFKAPFGFDTLSSSNATFFTERSMTDIWSPDRHVGVAYQTWGERWQTKLNFFGQALDDTSGHLAVDDTTLATDQGWGYAARFTFAPMLISDTKAVHLGVATAYRRPNAGPDGKSFYVDLTGRPEAGKISKAKFLGAEIQNVDNMKQYGAEFVGIWGPFSWQSEYQMTEVNRRAGVGATAALQLASSTDHKFSAYYGQVSWIFGGQRTYEVSDGLFGKVSPSSKRGALELVARYSTMNQDDLTTIDPVKGGIVKNISAGLTYYMNKNIRWMADVTHVTPNENSKPNKRYNNGATGLVSDKFYFTTLRLQVNF